MKVELSEEEIGSLLAALNYTKARVYDVSWESRDENIKRKLEKLLHKSEGNWRNLIETWG